MKDKAVVIRGLGLVTPLGAGARATWLALLAGHAVSSTGLCSDVDHPSQGDRVSALAHHAANEALREAGWNDFRHQPSRSALIIGTSKGAIDAWCNSTGPGPRSDNPEGEIWPLGLHSIAQRLNSNLGLHWPSRTISAACASGLCASSLAALLIRQGEVDRALIVAAESSLHPAILQSYRRLGVMAAAGEVTRPFDHRRSGFIVSEAAAAIAIERAEPAPGDIIIENIWSAADASHITGMNIAAPAMRYCLSRVIAGGAVDLFHAHATGTLMNDPIELEAIAFCKASVNEPAVIYSHKGAIGHTMGASGLISVAINIMVHREGRIPPNVHTQQPIPTAAGAIKHQVIARPVRRSVVIAAGFGGPVAALSLRSA